MNRDERTYLQGYKYGAREVAEMKKLGYARGKGCIKLQLKHERQNFEFDIQDWFGDGVIDAFLDAVN